VIIIGGTRFIGPPVARRLSEAGHDVTVFHRGQTESDLPKRVNHVHGNRLQLAAHQDELRQLQPDVVLDMAAFTQQDALATVNAFRGVARRLVIISSQDVYRAYGRFHESEPGLLEPVPLAETAPLREKLYPYRGEGRGLDSYDKILVERAAQSSTLLPATILRLPMVYGEGDYQHRLLLELKRIDDERPAILIAQRMAAWRWTRAHVENVAAAISLAVTDDRATSRTYNVGDAEALTYADWVRLIGHQARWAGDVVIAPDHTLPQKLSPLKGNYAQHLVVDTALIRTELGYQEPVPQMEALRTTIAWEREHRPESVAKLLDYAAEDAALAELRAKPAPAEAPRPPLLP
jgi:nucleoside-diphosphate-sugar epimerase